MSVKMIMTIDVEGHVGKDPIGRLIYGRCADGKNHGIDEEMDILDKYGIRGIFFVDIAEAWTAWGKQIRDVMVHIDQRGHDVGVHIHPDHMADEKRKFLHEYSHEEQYKMIKQCTEFYEEVLHKKPKAFRAGKYSADYRTLDILAQLKYEYDFSNFYGQKWCGINPPLTRQKICFYKTLMEIPVFSYKSFRFINYQRFDKLDVEIPFAEYKCVLDGIISNRREDDNEECIVVMFAHSFSLIWWRRHPDFPRYHASMAHRLKKMLEYVHNDKRFSFICLNEIKRGESVMEDSKSDSDNAVFFDMTQSRGLELKSYLFFFIRAMKVIKMRIDDKIYALHEIPGSSDIQS